MFDRQALVHCAPHQRAFIAFDASKSAMHLGFAAARALRASVRIIIALLGHQRIQAGEQRLLVNERKQTEHIRHFGDRK